MTHPNDPNDMRYRPCEYCGQQYREDYYRCWNCGNVASPLKVVPISVTFFGLATFDESTWSAIERRAATALRADALPATNTATSGLIPWMLSNSERATR